MRNGWTSLSCAEEHAPEMPLSITLCAIAIDKGNSTIEYGACFWYPDTKSFRFITLYGSIDLYPRYTINNVRKISVYAFKELGTI